MPSILTETLVCAARLLLEYNDSTAAICRTLMETAKARTDEPVNVAVKYGEVFVKLGDEEPAFGAVRELRYNARLQVRVRSILNDLRIGKIEPHIALDLLKHAEANSPPHPSWLVAVLVGAAAGSLAILLGADVGASVVACVSTTLGLFARHELARRHFNLFSLPFTAAFLGAALASLAIRFGWTSTPALALVVPSLMLIPGPHLINSMLDLIDNYLSMSIARFTLAVGILVASAFGIVLAMELILSAPPVGNESANTEHLNLISDMVLAGIVTCGFAVYYNAAWPHIGLAVIGGMAGHGLRYLALETGSSLEVATFLGAFVVGAISTLIARSYRIPVAVIAFAGAVTMMPGLQMFRALGGSLRLAQLKADADLTIVSGVLGEASQACYVVGALVLGLVVAVRMLWTLLGNPDSCSKCSQAGVVV